MTRVLQRLGTGLVFLGFCMAAAGVLIVALDAVVWVISGHWQSASLWSLFGPLQTHPFSNWEALKVGLWVQPIWVLMVLLGGLWGLLGSILIKDDGK